MTFRVESICFCSLPCDGQPLAGVHFEPPLTFYDLFLPKRLSSVDRARAFLWLIYHYLEGPDRENPFHDDYSRKNPRKIPLIRRVAETEIAHHNVDTPEEIEWGRKMSNQRHSFLRKLVSSIDDTKRSQTRDISSDSQGCISIHPIYTLNIDALYSSRRAGG